MSNGARAGIGVAAIALVVVLFVVLRGGDDDDSTTTAAPQTTTAATTTDEPDDGDEEPPASRQARAEPDVPVIEVKDGQPVGGVQELELRQGRRHPLHRRVRRRRGGPLPRLRRRAGRQRRRQGRVRRPGDARGRVRGRARALASSRSPRSRSTRSRPGRRGAARPASIAGHALVGRQDLPIPEWLFAWGASLVLIVSFVALSLAWHTPKFEDDSWRPLARAALRGLLVNPVTEVARRRCSASSCSASSSGRA